MGDTQNKANQELEDKSLDADDNPEEEEKVLKESSDEEIRAGVIKKFGLDEFDDEELIAKLVEDKKEERKNFSKVIRQKRGWREKAKKPPTAEPPKEEKGDEATRRVVDETLDERKLDEMDLTDETKSAIKTYAKANKVSISVALKSEFFTFLKDKEDKKKREEEASTGPTHQTHTRRNWEELAPADFDLTTEEGRKDFAEWKKRTGRTG